MKYLSSKQIALRHRRRKIRKLREELKAYKLEVRIAATNVRGAEKRLGKLCKMRPGGGRPKGTGFENEIAIMVWKAFKKFGIRRRHCYRTPLSGGHRFASKKDPGDLQMSRRLRSMFSFVVECKNYKKIDLGAFLYSPKEWLKAWHFGKWLAQVCNAAKGKREAPLLVFKGKSTEPYAAFPTWWNGRLLVSIAGLYQHIKFEYDHKDWVVIRFQKLLQYMVSRQERISNAKDL